MNNMKGFILGFGLSILGLSLYNPQHVQSKTNDKTDYNNYKIDLFKQAKADANSSFGIASIEKTTIFASGNALETTAKTLEDIKDIDDIATNQTQDNIDSFDIALDTENINGLEDEEILNINMDDIIPIEINPNHIQNAKVTDIEDTEKVAMLPTSLDINESNDETEESPWVIAKGSKHIDNKMRIEENDTFEVSTNINQEEKFAREDLSYEITQKIKQNIIFPIPDEILNDENLTPTFIRNTPKENNNSNAKKVSQPKLLEKKQVETKETKNEQSNIISNISSWLGKPSNNQENAKPKKTKVAPPLYNTETSSIENSSNNNQSTNQDISSFYEALQKTKQAHNQKKITPSELKLYFNPDRAEISGQTLRWLKAFSEKAKEESCFIQVKMDATAPIELQRKRLNLIYTTFINNNVDLNKVDTMFSNIEANTFIIRTIKIGKNQN